MTTPRRTQYGSLFFSCWDRCRAIVQCAVQPFSGRDAMACGLASLRPATLYLVACTAACVYVIMSQVIAR
ncbi:hypothetical protein BJX64DRAFT_271992 [Aspergillus heterothallicus]